MPSPEFKQLVESAKKDIREIQAGKVYHKLENDGSIHIIDIREDYERRQAAIPESIHINRGILERDIDEEVSDNTREIILYCGGGRRSALAAKNLQKMGYENVYSLKGGFRAWKDQKLPILTD